MTRRLLWAFPAWCACASTPPPSPPPPAAVSAPADAGTAQHGVVTSDMDRTQDPCTDFYAYANGAWRAANPIPPSMDRWSRRWQAGETNTERLKDLLEEISKRTDWPTGGVEQLVGDFYASCMDEVRIEQAGLTPLQPLLSQIDAIASAADLQRVIRRLQDVDVSVPFAVGARPDQHLPTRTIADIGASGLGLPDRDYYFKTEERFVATRKEYRAHMARMFALAGAVDSAETVFAFEKRLAEASLDNVALRDPKATDHLMGFDELQKLAPHFDWAGYIAQAHLPRQTLNVEEPKFLQAVDRELAQTSLADWRSYLKWQLLASAAPELSKAFVEESFAFNRKYLAGIAEMKPRWKRCAETADRLLGEALGRKYVERYFPPAAKARVQALVRNELTALRQIILALPWMGPKTKEQALVKLATFNPKVGYPDKWKDYSKVEIRRDAYWLNVVAASEFNVNEARATVGKPTDRGRWGMTPSTSNAYYNPLLNEIVFPAGILQPPAFDIDATDAVNYGAIGVVIGHEISHGFDDQGAQYDAQGRLENWWAPEDLAAFQGRAECVVRQFDGYFIEPGLHHNGKLVLGESIADFAGARIAFLAFQKALEDAPEAKRDGFTPEQQFFIAWGQFRGDATRIETQRKMVQGDPHPVAKYRVLGPLSNLPAFQQAFACQPAAAMVRPVGARCEVW
jgi:putative endopeptidase